MSFLGNRAVTLLGLHLVCKRLAQSFGDLFGPVFLYSLGIPLPVIFFVWATQYALRLVVRPFALKFQTQIGLKKSVIIGTLIFAGLYPVLGIVDGINWHLGLFIVYAAIADCLYWLPFHAYYAALGDLEHRGKQIGVREGLVAIVSAAGPALGGLVVATFGFSAAFYAAGIITACAAIFLFRLHDVSPGQRMNFREAWRSVSLRGLFLYISDSAVYHANAFTWALVVFLMFGNYATFGGLTGLAAFFAAVSYLVFGRLIDGGHGRLIGMIGCAAVGAAVIIRSRFGISIPTVIAADLFFALALPFYVATVNTMLYNSAKKSLNTHWFHFFAETGWDLGAIAMLVAIGTAVSFGVELRTMMFAALVGVGLMGVNVVRYFGRNME